MRAGVCLGFLFICVLAKSPETTPTVLQNDLQADIRKVFEGEKPGKVLKQVMEDLQIDQLLQDPTIPTTWENSKINLLCTSCVTVVELVLGYLYSGNHTLEQLIQTSITGCIDVHFGNDVFCEGYMPLIVPQFAYVLENSPKLTANDVCGTFFQLYGCHSRNPDRVWEIQVPDGKPDVSEPPYVEDVPKMKVLHLADTHIHFHYTPGSNPSNCPEKKMCCTPTNGPAEDPEDAAGFWGDYRNCDLPVWTLEAMYKHIAETHKDIDLIIWTGDIVPHNVWQTSKEGNLAIIKAMSDMVKQYFPGIPVFPAIGNHDSNPDGAFPQPYVDDPEFDISWLYDNLYDYWSYWLPDEVAKGLTYGGFYSTPIAPGWRLIALNTQYCYSWNMWLLMDSHDAAEELERLVDAMKEAEDNHEYVYIIGHVPPGDMSCLYTWSHELNKIISRFEDTVTGLFFGHTHTDQYHVYFEPGTNRPHDIAYIAQSQTCHTHLNPGYKIYTVEGDYGGSRHRVLDHDNYIMNLDEANTNNITRFFKLYSAKEEYGLSDLSPQSWTDLVSVMAQPNSTVFDKFYRNFVKNARPRVEDGCEGTCKEKLLCSLLRADSSDESHCKNL